MTNRLLRGATVSQALAERLEQEQCMLPLDASDARLFGLFELSALAATRGGAHVEPEQLMNPALQAQWRKQVAQGSWIDFPFELGRRPYWIVHAGKRIGTIAYMVKPYNLQPTVDISSVYLRREYRRQGWGSRILALLTAAAFDVGLDCVTLETEWNAQEALRFYCAQGMWLRMWKDGLQLHVDRGRPRWQMDVRGNEAHFLVDERVVGVARNRGTLLDWVSDETLDADLKFSLEMTAALQLALMRWPIIRSEALWQEEVRHGCGDCGSFEAFALRLRQFDSEIRRLGWSLPAETNPSFESLPHVLEVNVDHNNQLLQVLLGDGARLAIPVIDLRYRLEDAGDMLESATIVDDDVQCVYQSGDRSTHSVDDLLQREHAKHNPRYIVCVMNSVERCR